MCLAIPGKIIYVKKNTATIDYGSEHRQAKILLGNFNPGDFVIVQNKIVIEKVPKEQVKGWISLLKHEA